MRVLIEGSGGASGWPQPGCRCASCLRKTRDGNIRVRSTIVIDGKIRLGTGCPRSGSGESGDAEGEATESGGGDIGEAVVSGYRVRQLADARDPGHPGEPAGPGGWDVTAPEGGRLLYPAGPGAVPVPPDGAARYDIAFLDLLGDPAQLGLLRARGLITDDTITAVAFADHRVASEAELRRRCGFWHAQVLGDGESVTTVRSEKKGLKDFGETARRVPWRVLVVGGARSGKSEQAELRLAGEPEVTYVATGPPSPDGAGSPADPDWAARVAAHRARRPAWWRTAETTDLAGVLASARGALLIDGIGTWLAAVLDECGAWGGSAEAAARLAARIAELVAAWRQTGAHVVAVSDEAGLGVVPATPAGRLFRDELGRLNQALAAESEETELVVAGRILPLTLGTRMRRYNSPVTIRTWQRVFRPSGVGVCPARWSAGPAGGYRRKSCSPRGVPRGSGGWFPPGPGGSGGDRSPRDSTARW
jgi:adenosylcobinamide kinase / adenosylcobinamide-phosphate guanylyltransferase